MSVTREIITALNGGENCLYILRREASSGESSDLKALGGFGVVGGGGTKNYWQVIERDV